MKHICFNSFFAILLAYTTFTPSCKKYIEQQEKKAALAIITNGLWFVAQYQQNDSDLTPSFSGYLFKFDENGVVTGTKNSVSTKGIWSADISNKSIIADFPSGNDTLKLLNETWKIKDSSSDSVLAKSTDTLNNTNNILKLRKQ
ncbi:hypothetical protein ACX0G9_08725 [Flavitalea flava]